MPERLGYQNDTNTIIDLLNNYQAIVKDKCLPIVLAMVREGQEPSLGCDNCIYTTQWQLIFNLIKMLCMLLCTRDFSGRINLKCTPFSHPKNSFITIFAFGIPGLYNHNSIFPSQTI